MIQSFVDEFRAAARQLRQRLGFTLGATLSLALGMSLATAVYSVRTAALRPLPFPEPDRLGYVYEKSLKTGEFGGGSRVPARHLVALRTDASSLTELAAWKERYALLGESGEARSVSAKSVTENFFAVLRVRPLIGRVFTRNDRNAPVVVLSHALWASQFGSRPDIVGQSVRIGGEEHSVIGVMGPAFDFPRGTRIWFLVSDDAIAREAASPIADNDWPKYMTFGRLAPGASFAGASAESGTIFRRLYGEHPERRHFTTTVMPLGDAVTVNLRSQLALWAAAATLILILCAVNFATMSLSRGMRRRGETAIRAAMGATRTQLVRASVLEALLLAVASGALAILLAWWLLTFATVWFANGVLPVDPSIDWRTIAFGVGATILVGFVFALAPALELANVDLRQILAGSATSATARRGEMRGRRVLVAMQLSFALTGVAVVVALIKADRRWQAMDVGIDYEQLVLGDLHGPPRPGAMFSWDAFRPDSTASRVSPGLVLDRLRASPGVSDAALIANIRRVTVWHRTGEVDEYPWYEMHTTPNLFSVLGVQLLAGRLPTADERLAGTTLVANEVFARNFAGSVSAAVGMQLRVQRGSRRPKETVTIVGVVPFYSGSGLWNIGSGLYALEDPQPSVFATVVMRVQGNPQVHANGMARNLAGLDPRIMVTNVATAKSRVDAAQGATRGRTIFLSAVAALALALAIIGVYSLTSYTTQMRLREFGIRIALGASTPRLAGAVFGDLWWMSLLGVGIGVVASGRLTAFLDDIYRNPMMPGRLIVLPVMPMIAYAVTLVVIAIVATAAPMRRVLRMDVMRTVQGSG